MKIYKCELCGNIVELIEASGVPVMCCGEDMTEMAANTTDGAVEKHVPVVETDGNTVRVKIGETDHPMADAHYIQWVAIETTCGYQRKSLKPGDKPEACFALCEGEKVKAAYAYCNLHELWVA